MSDILLYSSENAKLEPLKNDYHFNFRDKGEEYNSISQYIYSNLIVGNKTQKNIMKRHKKSQILMREYKKYRENIIAQTIEDSFDKAARELYRQPRYRELLLNTYGRYLLYFSNSRLMGINPKYGNLPNSRNRNIIGLGLMKIRDIISREQMEQGYNRETDNIWMKLYSRYRLINVVKYLYVNGHNNLSEFTGLPLNDLLTHKEIKNRLDILTPDMETFKKIYRAENFQDMDILRAVYWDDNSTGLVEYIKSRYYREYNSSIETRKKDAVLRFYLGIIAIRNYPNVKNVNLAVSQQISKLSVLNLKSLRDRVYAIFNMGLFDSKASGDIFKIGGFESKINMEFQPEQEYKSIVEAKEVIFPERPEYKPIQTYNEAIDISDMNNELYIGNNSFIFIDNYPYPSILHYIYSNLLGILPNMTFIKARNMIMLNPSGDQLDPKNYVESRNLHALYMNITKRQTSMVKMMLLEKSLGIKFQDKYFLDILIKNLPHGAKIIYDDPNDLFLGIRDGKGKNKVGLVLEKIRSEMMKSERIDFELNQPSISKFAQDIPVLEKWFMDRVRDSVRVIELVYEFYTSQGIRISIDSEFVKLVMYGLYTNCFNIQKTSRDYKMVGDFPKKIRFISRYPIEDSGVMALWSYISTLFYHLYKLVRDNNAYGSDVDTFLNKMYRDILHPKQKIKCEGPYNDNLDNCIFQSVKQLSDKIIGYGEHKYNKKIVYDKNLILLSSRIIYPSPTINEFDEFSNDLDVDIAKRLSKSVSLESSRMLNGFIRVFRTQYKNRDMAVSSMNRLLFFSN